MYFIGPVSYLCMCIFPSRHLCEILRNTVNVYTLEVSFYGYNQPVTNAIVSYNEDGCKGIKKYVRNS